MSFRVKFNSYTGDGTFYCVPTDMAECRRIARQLLARHRKVMGYPVATLERGRKWELQTGDDAAMVGWGEGVLLIVQACAMCEKQIPDSPGDDDLCDRCQEAEDEADFDGVDDHENTCDTCDEQLPPGGSSPTCFDCLRLIVAGAVPDDRLDEFGSALAEYEDEMNEEDE